jgi:hypothetical protein
VFVRVDERGGRDEPSPWAAPPLASLRVPGDVDGDDAFIDLGDPMASNEATATGPAQLPMPLPAARERASVYVVPAAGGVVGRGDAAAVCVRERSVSRRHATLSRDDRGWFIVDDDSDNGSGVNGMPLVPGTPQQVRSGDVVSLGDVSFVFLEGAAFHEFLPALTGA